MISTISTTVLVLSDTHGVALAPMTPLGPIDVAIHCGDLTEESKLGEIQASIALLEQIPADLKLVIAGNHDWTLDDRIFRRKVAEMQPSEHDLKLVDKVYGTIGEARRLLKDASASGIVYLDEGTHTFQLANGASLTVYASPYTPSTSEWAFDYDTRDEHDWNISDKVDIAITHSPPKGVLDYTESRERAGSPELFEAIARARPQMHRFGHIHEAWGAKTVAWIESPSEKPSHFTDIDNDESELLESLSGLRAHKLDDADRIAEKAAKSAAHAERGYCVAKAGKERTLFVNAAIEGGKEGQQQWPWLVDLELPATSEEQSRYVGKGISSS